MFVVPVQDVLVSDIGRVRLASLLPMIDSIPGPRHVSSPNSYLPNFCEAHPIESRYCPLDLFAHYNYEHNAIHVDCEKQELYCRPTIYCSWFSEGNLSGKISVGQNEV